LTDFNFNGDIILANNPSATAPSAVVPLSELEPGEKAHIVRVRGFGPMRRRFMEMGLVPGEKIVVERVAPLGDPIEFLVKGYHLSLRRREARHIKVTREGYAEGRGRRWRRGGGPCPRGRGGRRGGRKWRIW
jgi:ferrous iron transport protein A